MRRSLSDENCIQDKSTLRSKIMSLHSALFLNIDQLRLFEIYFSLKMSQIQVL